MKDLAGIIAIISIISLFALPLIVALVLIFKKINSTHKERMGMIQQGIIPPNVAKRKRTTNRYVSLRNGFVLVGTGIGITVGIIGIQVLEFAVPHAILFITASTVFFLGIGYLVFFLVTNNMKEHNSLDLDSELQDDAE